MIPVIDLSTIRGDSTDGTPSQTFLDTWDRAFRDFGFIILINHGLEEKYRQLHQALAAFFELPMEEKLMFRIAEEYGHGGYIPEGQESVSQTYLDESRQRPPDAVESLTASRAQPDVFPCVANGYSTDALRDLSADLEAGLDKLTVDVMGIMTKCLSLPEDYFLPFYQDGRADNNLRAARYLPMSEDKGHGQMRYGEHTDYTGFTFLWRSADNGLQCLNRDAAMINENQADAIPEENQWLDIPRLPDHPDALVVNAGDLIQRWTNDYWVSNVHRVIGDYDAASSDNFYPISIVYFTGPHPDTRISVLTESEKVSSKGPVSADRLEVITAGEHLWQKLNASN